MRAADGAFVVNETLSQTRALASGFVRWLVNECDAGMTFAPMQSGVR
jgi:hypothetical protein